MNNSYLELTLTVLLKTWSEKILSGDCTKTDLDKLIKITANLISDYVKENPGEFKKEITN